MMNMHTRNQYLKEVRLEYLKAAKHHKTKLLDEAAKRTSLERKYLIKKLKPQSNLDRMAVIKRARKTIYDGEVKAALAQCWKIFDYPCGQRLSPLLKTEVCRLRRLRELWCGEGTAAKLTIISPSSIDRALRHTKEVERLTKKHHYKIHPLLYQKIPVKVFAEQDRAAMGSIQVDLVEHCGQSAAGDFLNTLSTTDISSGWWEGEAIMGKGQRNTQLGLNLTRDRYPFKWEQVHSDNGAEFINWHLYDWCGQEGLDFSRSRPYKKNDNCLVEQKNWTHVKKFVGYLRYDTDRELAILNDLYRHEWRLFKNFFQPVIKLIGKERKAGKIMRKYDRPRTPYIRVMESKEVPPEVKENLRRTYESLNPAELKREIDKKLLGLSAAYRQKQSNGLKVETKKKLQPATVSFLMTQPRAVLVSS